MLRHPLIRTTLVPALVPALAAAVMLGASATSASAQKPVIKEEKAGMAKQARITGDAATATALARVPRGVVQSGELEMEKGKLVYSFDIRVPGKSGIEEVLVDANTGAVLSVEHETPAAEAKEAKADKAKAKTKKG